GRRSDPGRADDDGPHRQHGGRGARRPDGGHRRAPRRHDPPGRALGPVPREDPGPRRPLPQARRPAHEDQPARLPDPARDLLGRADGRHLARAARAHACIDAEGARRPPGARRAVVATAGARAAMTALDYDAAARSAADTMEAIEEERLELGETSEDALGEPLDLLEAGDEAPVIRLVNALFFQAVKDGASDIHVEPYERTVTVRFRVDGLLHDVVSPPAHLHARLVSRLKIMARLDIAERRLP